MTELVDEIVRLAGTDPVDFDRIEVLFGEASRRERESALEQFDPPIQRRLFEQAEGRPVERTDIVPDDAEPLEEIVHQGRNTLPLFQSFQKRFCRPPATPSSDRDDPLWGYNEQMFKPLTGPGYFVGYPDPSTGEFCVDYRELPDERPDHWPEIIPNSSRLGRFVYAGTVDRLRSIAPRITVGRAYVDDDEPMNAWFVLARRDPE